MSTQGPLSVREEITENIIAQLQNVSVGEVKTFEGMTDEEKRRFTEGYLKIEEEYLRKRMKLERQLEEEKKKIMAMQEPLTTKSFTLKSLEVLPSEGFTPEEEEIFIPVCEQWFCKELSTKQARLKIKEIGDPALLKRYNEYSDAVIINLLQAKIKSIDEKEEKEKRAVEEKNKFIQGIQQRERNQLARDIQREEEEIKERMERQRRLKEEEEKRMAKKNSRKKKWWIF